MSPVMNLSQAQAMIHPPPQPLMINRSYNAWRRQHQQQQFTAANPPQFNTARNNNNNNWKGKKGNDKRNILPVLRLTGGQSNYNLSNLQSQNQNRTKPWKLYSEKNHNTRFAPYAPRNTTSFIIRAKKFGGIASLVSPSPVTPAVLPTLIFSPSREVLVERLDERLRSPGNDENDDDGSSESDVEERVEVEYNNVMENRVDDQDARIAQLEEENLTLKERMFLVERDLEDLRRRMVFSKRGALWRMVRTMRMILMECRMYRHGRRERRLCVFVSRWKDEQSCRRRSCFGEGWGS